MLEGSCAEVHTGRWPTGSDLCNLEQSCEVAWTTMGSGWAALVWEPIGKKLLITQIYDHQSNLAQGGVPLLVIDAWEPLL